MNKFLAMMFPFAFVASTRLLEVEQELSKKNLEIGKEHLTRDERRLSRIQLEVQSHIESNKRSLEDEYNLIKEKKSNLSLRCRQFIINHFNNK
jgi:hypothetical protein